MNFECIGRIYLTVFNNLDARLFIQLSATLCFITTRHKEALTFYGEGLFHNLVAGERPLRYLRDEFSSCNALQDKALQQSDDNSDSRDPLGLLQLFRF
jgi:hypothetical protein